MTSTTINPAIEMVASTSKNVSPVPMRMTRQFGFIACRLIRNRTAIGRNRSARGSRIPSAAVGLTFAIKDNIDSPRLPQPPVVLDFSYLPSDSASVVSRLCNAGAVVLGKTNLDQFRYWIGRHRARVRVVKNPFNAEFYFRWVELGISRCG